MKKKSLIAVVSVFLLFGISVVALAGVEPTPFMPEINKLGAIENSLNSIDKRITDVLGVPPDDIMPSAANKINAMDHQLQLLNGLLESTMGEIMDAVLAVPPDDQMPVINALSSIGYVMINDGPEGGITGVVNRYLNDYFPDGGFQAELEEFFYALIQFRGNANKIMENVTNYIGQITSGSLD